MLQTSAHLTINVLVFVPNENFLGRKHEDVVMWLGNCFILFPKVLQPMLYVYEIALNLFLNLDIVFIVHSLINSRIYEAKLLLNIHI